MLHCLTLAAGMQAPEELHDSLRELEPLPQHPLLAAARARHLQLCSSVRLAEELLRFAKRAAAMPAVMRTRAVAALSQVRQQHACSHAVHARYLQLCSSVRLAEELLHFAKRAAMPAVMRSCAVATLSQVRAS